MSRTRIARPFPKSNVRLFLKRIAKLFQRSNVATFQARPVRTPQEKFQDKNARISQPSSAVSNQINSATTFPSSCAIWSTRRAVKTSQNSSAQQCPRGNVNKCPGSSVKLPNLPMEGNENLALDSRTPV